MWILNDKFEYNWKNYRFFRQSNGLHPNYLISENFKLKKVIEKRNGKRKWGEQIGGGGGKYILDIGDGNNDWSSSTRFSWGTNEIATNT
jgi:hypothetical protein